MSWTSILTMMVLAIATAILVMYFKLEFWKAVVIVVGITVSLLLGLFAVLLGLSDPQNRIDLWMGFRTEFLKELKAMLAVVRGK